MKPNIAEEICEVLRALEELETQKKESAQEFAGLIQTKKSELKQLRAAVEARQELLDFEGNRDRN